MEANTEFILLEDWNGVSISKFNCTNFFLTPYPSLVINQGMLQRNAPLQGVSCHGVWGAGGGGARNNPRTTNRWGNQKYWESWLWCKSGQRQSAAIPAGSDRERRALQAIKQENPKAQAMESDQCSGNSCTATVKDLKCIRVHLAGALLLLQINSPWPWGWISQLNPK